ncbi:MAG: glycosyltransferase [Candidatus Sumerlaeota bacterium]|nr:glycosyltransferase [Candidatus Sumerlaeota bacterium]
MHVMFVHQNFPAQFGHIASYMIKNLGWECTFVSRTNQGVVEGIKKIQYSVAGGATKRTHYFTRTFENNTWHAAGVYYGLRPVHAVLQPDLIVGHSGFGSTLFLPELFPKAPVLNYFEFFYYPHNSDLDFRKDSKILEEDVLRSRCRNAMILLDLEYCTAGYSPTEFQRSLLPEAYKEKVRVLHDGIDTEFWKRTEPKERAYGAMKFSPDTRIVTYVSRGFEAARGFDVFMRAAKRIYEMYPNVVFLCVGSERVAYGGDMRFIKEKSYKEHVLKQDNYDLNKIRFLGTLPPAELVKVLSLSDLHIYLTVPFVLSWSVLDSMACRCTMLCSDTAPVREMIKHHETGLLFDFHDDKALAEMAVEVLKDPEAYRHLGHNAEELIRKHYSMEVIMPQMVDLYQDVANMKVDARQAGFHKPAAR